MTLTHALASVAQCHSTCHAATTVLTECDNDFTSVEQGLWKKTIFMLQKAGQNKVSCMSKKLQ